MPIKATNECKYIYKQGQNAGKRCNKKCVSEYCKDHKQSKTNYRKHYYDNVLKEKKERELKDILQEVKNKKNITMDELLKFKNKVLDKKYECIKLCKKIIGIKIFLNLITEEKGNKIIKKFMFNKCTCNDEQQITGCRYCFLGPQHRPIDYEKKQNKENKKKAQEKLEKYEKKIEKMRKKHNEMLLILKEMNKKYFDN